MIAPARGADSAAAGPPPRLHPAAVFIAFTLLTVWYTNPLILRSWTHIAGDPGDPVLNASILWWNATTMPLSEQWWNPPFFYPSEGVTTFTEHLLGVSVLATPIYWLTRDPLFTYNVMMFLTWPLCAAALYLLVLFLTRRHDAAIVAGLIWAFSPYRLSGLGHLQSMSAYGLPLILLGLHGFVERRTARWLLLFGGAWLLQALANGYYMIFAPVLIALWILYFCSARGAWRTVPAIVATWVIASVPLVPIVWKYAAVHEHYALSRSLTQPAGFSADTWNFAQVAPVSWWLPVLGSRQYDLFPGFTALGLVIAAFVVWLVHGWGSASHEPRSRRIIRAVLATVTVGQAAGLLAMLVVGPWRVSSGEFVIIRMTRFDRGLAIATLTGVGWLVLSNRARSALARRSPWVFYAATTVVLALLACGPMLIAGGDTLLASAPYAWLMTLPGFDRLRVPSRFWTLGTLCLAIAAGLSLVRIPLPRSLGRAAACAVIAGCALMDGWINEFPVAAPPEHWVKVERRDSTLPILEMPLGPEWDAAATFRSIRHRRRVLNGVSGYDPPHYAPLQAGLNAHDPAMLSAIASLGSFDIVIDSRADRDGAWARYASSAVGAAAVATDGVRTTYRIPASPPQDVRLGPALRIAGVQASADGVNAAVDGRLDTEWHHYPEQFPAYWFVVDLGTTREVGGVTHALGQWARDFPRQLAIDLSTDGERWETVWTGPTVAAAFLGAVRGPREATMRFRFEPRPARFVRLRPMVHHVNLWRIAEVQVHGAY
jgi:F5/8 type C domain